MSFPDLLYRFVGFSGFLTEALVCVLAVVAYQATRQRPLLLIAVSSGMGAVVSVLPEIPAAHGWGFWYFEMLVRVAACALYLVGVSLLFRSYTALVLGSAQRTAPPNAGTAEPPANSDVSSGPPSVA